MSTTFVAAIIGLLAVVLPYFNVHVAPEAVEGFVNVVIALGTSVWIMYQRTTLEHAPAGKGDVTLGGVRK